MSKSVRFHREKELNRRVDIARQLREARAARKQQEPPRLRALLITLFRRALEALEADGRTPAPRESEPGC